MLKQLFAYIRVSDPKQGKGVSLAEQRSIIEAYAARIGAIIIEWFVEKRTAAKTGRPEFERMVKLVRAKKADGFIVHKLDRSTRNWYDWAEINDLLDNGVDVHNASENVELRSNGNRLQADMEIVVAVHYIRNLRAEALKGIEGRLKQGILPCGVCIGYLNTGAGNPKAIDPVKGPLVRKLFELYATGRYSLNDLRPQAEKIGLLNRNGRPLHMQELQKILRNPFYVGIIRSKRFGLFQGAHKPLVSRALFDRVQAVLDGRAVRQTKRFTFLFRRLLHCKTCGRSLIASERKGWIYYRCSTNDCPTTSLREDRIEDLFRSALRRIDLAGAEDCWIETEIAKRSEDQAAVLSAKRTALQEALAALNARSSRLTDLLLDGKIEVAAHDERRATLLADRQRLEQELIEIDIHEVDLGARLTKIVGLARSPETLYESLDCDQKRQLFEIVVSDCVADGKNLEFVMREPFLTFSRRPCERLCGHHYDTPRTFSLAAMLSQVAELPQAVIDSLQSISLTEPVKPVNP